MIFFYGFCCGVASFGIAVALIELVRCIDYPHCAGCGAAEWEEVNVHGIVESYQGNL